MDRDETLTILRRLRDGRDPECGDALPEDHVCQRVDVVRALFAAVEALEARPVAAAVEPAPQRSRRALPPNAGRAWNDDDDRRLAEAFDGGADERELAAMFGRSRSSVRARLIRLGRGALLGEGPTPRYPVLAPSAEAAAESDADGADVTQEVAGV